ncbi:ATP-dependent DNA helicase [Chromobacterium amazonense]|uniref:DEAD/DEAH box helicase n=1 Tax=Chromobacterium amazonense TaxID=1382803 RepID=UPI0008D96184|nr:DEAD/DEAH box helicase [Chromobacterium amazonense]OHX15698.1 ATP-dependent DNA helicase [Chromobacterium amazonense]
MENIAYLEELISKLEINSIKKQIFKITNDVEIEELSDRDISKLFGQASILSLSENSDDLALCYEIITRLLEITDGGNIKVINAAEVILSRIGNFPGRTLLRNRYTNGQIRPVSAALKLECIAREAENSIYINSENPTLLTDFQYKLFKSLQEEKSISFSAPTSAGKSFILNLDLIRKINNKKGQSIVYIVPTRALISEVSSRIRNTLRENSIHDAIIRTAPFPVQREKIKSAVIYVLTQERLLSLLNTPDEHLFITSLIVDEAHEIQKGKRGIVLESAVSMAISRFPNADILFASPLIKNPSYFLELFGRNNNGRYFVESLSPVSQNILLLSEVDRKPNQMNLSLITREKTINIGQYTLKFRLRGEKVTQRANIAIMISNGTDSVISYSNEPSAAENIAEEISNIIDEPDITDDTAIFIEFLKNEIHPEYPLIKCLQKGVAFHYGKMPSLVRSGVERLFRNGDVKIICCTSTLLQGVNLPAKHIIIEDPKSGDHAMKRSDFLNLAGRAGRLLKEFHGNIWCIRPSKWKEASYKGEKLQEISSAISDLMKDGGTDLQKLINKEPLSDQDKERAEAALGKLYADMLRGNDTSHIESYRNESNSHSIDKTILSIKNIKTNIPIDIISKNQSIRPDLLQNLFGHLNQQSSLSQYLPISPYTTGGKARMEFIFDKFYEFFEWNVDNKYASLISWIAHNWVWGHPTKRILSERISNVQSKNPATPASKIIRDALKILEDEIRFKLVKYFSAYIDMMRHILSVRNQNQIAERIEPYHIYLEFGSCDKKMLNLMALGLSRFTAIHLIDLYDFSKAEDHNDYINYLYRIDLRTSSMPTICKYEIKDLIG